MPLKCLCIALYVIAVSLKLIISTDFRLYFIQSYYSLYWLINKFVLQPENFEPFGYFKHSNNVLHISILIKKFSLFSMKLDVQMNLNNQN